MHETYTTLKIVVKRNSDETLIGKILQRLQRLQRICRYDLKYEIHNNNNEEAVFVININWKDYLILCEEICYEMHQLIRNFNELQEQISITFTFNSKDEDDYNSNNFIDGSNSNNFIEEDSEEVILHAIALPSSNNNELVQNIIKWFEEYLILISATEIIITDQYILKTNIDTIKTLFSELKLKLTKKLEKVTFIIPKLDSKKLKKLKLDSEELEKLKSTFQKTFSSINLNLNIMEVEAKQAFHDRFWLFRDEQGNKDGLFVGTSLNGLGKYNIITRIEKKDISILFDVLEKLLGSEIK